VEQDSCGRGYGRRLICIEFWIDPFALEVEKCLRRSKDLALAMNVNGMGFSPESATHSIRLSIRFEGEELVAVRVARKTDLAPYRLVRE
jgi:hypothetical protein